MRMSTADSEGRALQPEELAVAIIVIANTYCFVPEHILTYLIFIVFYKIGIFTILIL